ncbi:acyltransferase [Paenibacillus sp. S150]|uniref:acyltransferase family protein n=1 Tax=Paenibacillus sp. S150 TaxID=2749826 RepID=UPI001C592653|nr:acyltransferase [Paenibacillus sp. S150]MBW4083540.1 acyltransferase [Paenibacillus sp. S150]
MSKERAFLFDKVCTSQSKGIAIIFVLISHLNEQLGGHKIFEPLGSIGVALFLFASGYGLTKSQEKGGLQSFFKKRITVVLVPYMFVTFLWIIVDYLTGNTHSLKTIVLAILGFDFSRSIDPTMWYISFVLVWYTAFYICFVLTLNNIVRVMMLFTFSVVCIGVWQLNLIGSGSYEWGLHSLIFPIGAWFALFGEKFIRKYKTKSLLSLMALSIIMGILNNYIVLNSGIYNAVNDVIGTVFIVCGLMLLRHSNFKSLFLELAGKYSYEIYLFEGYFLYRMNFFEIIENKGLALISYLSLVLVLSYLLKKIIDTTKHATTIISKVRADQ